MKKVNQKEVLEMLMLIARSAKKILRNVHRNDTTPVELAEQKLKELREEYKDSCSIE